MKSGDFNIDLLDLGTFALDGGAMFGVVPKALWSKAYNPGDELNRIPLAARPLLIRSKDRTILVDTGNGTKLNDKLRKIYSIDNESPDIEKALQKLGVSADDITDVVFTHLHFDHCGGATKSNNGEIEPVFPNAKHYVQKDHLVWALNPTEKDRASFMPMNYQPLINAGIMETLDGNGELFQGISMLTVNGHTKSMQMVKIVSGEETFLYCADLCPTTAHVPVPYVMGYDNFPLTAMDEKKKYLGKAFEENWTLIFEHDAFRTAGKVDKTEKGFIFGKEISII